MKTINYSSETELRAHLQRVEAERQAFAEWIAEFWQGKPLSVEMQGLAWNAWRTAALRAKE